MSIEVTGPIDWSLVEAALVDWATAVVPQFNGAIFAHQNAPQPLRPYCVFTLENIEAKGDDDVRLVFDPTSGGNDMIIAGQRVAQFGVDVIAGQQDEQYPDPNLTAIPLAERLVASTALEEILQPLRDVEVAVAAVSNIENLTALEGAQWVSRARFTLRLNIAANVEFETQQGIINSTEIEGPTNLTTPPNATQTIDGDNP